jgi:hypothetical protein
VAGAMVTKHEEEPIKSEEEEFVCRGKESCKEHIIHIYAPGYLVIPRCQKPKLKPGYSIINFPVFFDTLKSYS